MTKLPRRVLLVFALDLALFVFCLVGIHRATLRATVPVRFQSSGNFVLVHSIFVKNSLIPFSAGDTVVAVNGLTVTSPRDVEFVLDGLRIGDNVSLVLRKDGAAISHAVRLIPFYGKPYFVIQLIAGSLFFLLGLLTFVKRPQDEAAHVFHWVSVCVALMVMTTSNRHPADPWGISRVLDLLYSTASVFAPLLLVHFTFIFPRPKWPRAKRALAALYAAAVVLSIWESTTLFLSSSPVSMDWFHRFVKAYAVARSFFIVCILFFLASLMHSYRTAGEESERRKLRWVMLGLNLGPPAFIAWQIPILIGSPSLVREEYLHLALSLVPITFAISIIRYRLMDIDLIFRRSTVYAAVLVVLLSFYALVVGAAARLVGTFTVKWSLIASTLAAIVVALLFEPLRRVVQRGVDRAFFRVQYNYREAERQFVEAIKHCLNVRELAELIVRRFLEILPVERMGFFSVEKPGPHLHLAAHKNLERLQTHGILLDTKRLKGPFPLPLAAAEQLEPGIPFEPLEAETRQRWGVELAIPIQSKDFEVMGFLAVGPKRSGARYSLEDLDLLTTVTTQAGLAMERITLQEKLLLERAEARRLEELNRIKSYFVSSVSHDLKTPLTAIKMFAEILRSKSDMAPAEREECFEIIEGESERLARLINNVLDFAKVEQGVKEYHLAELEVNEGVRQILRGLRYQFKMENCKLITRLCPERLVVRADRDAFFEAVENLLSNALKYSPERKEVTVSTFCADGRAIVRVEDRGIGISAEDLPHIFEPFYRGKNELAQQAGGTGLGLALVKHMVELHGGKIEVESAPGKGSTFTLLFPLEEAHEANTDS